MKCKFSRSIFYARFPGILYFEQANNSSSQEEINDLKTYGCVRFDVIFQNQNQINRPLLHTPKACILRKFRHST